MVVRFLVSSILIMLSSACVLQSNGPHSAKPPLLDKVILERSKKQRTYSKQISRSQMRMILSLSAIIATITLGIRFATCSGEKKDSDGKPKKKQELNPTKTDKHPETLQGISTKKPQEDTSDPQQKKTLPSPTTYQETPEIDLGFFQPQPQRKKNKAQSAPLNLQQPPVFSEYLPPQTFPRKDDPSTAKSGNKPTQNNGSEVDKTSNRTNNNDAQQSPDDDDDSAKPGMGLRKDLGNGRFEQAF